MATAAEEDRDDDVTSKPELQNAPASMKSAVWQHFAFPVSYTNNERDVDNTTVLGILFCLTEQYSTL